MRKITLLLIMVLPMLLTANTVSNELNTSNPYETVETDHEKPKKRKKKKRKKSKKNASIRADRQIAITAVNGWTSLAGLGLMGSYYVQPKLGLDAGVGVGIKGSRIGVRGRYMFTENNFAPYAGVGLIQAFSALKDIQYINSETGTLVTFDRKPTTLAQLVVGFEFMSNGGFVIGLNAGYARALTSPINVTSGELEPIDRIALRTTYGGGLVAELNIGYAF